MNSELRGVDAKTLNLVAYWTHFTNRRTMAAFVLVKKLFWNYIYTFHFNSPPLTEPPSLVGAGHAYALIINVRLINHTYFFLWTTICTFKLKPPCGGRPYIGMVSYMHIYCFNTCTSACSRRRERESNSCCYKLRTPVKKMKGISRCPQVGRVKRI